MLTFAWWLQSSTMTAEKTCYTILYLYVMWGAESRAALCTRRAMFRTALQQPIIRLKCGLCLEYTRAGIC